MWCLHIEGALSLSSLTFCLLKVVLKRIFVWKIERAFIRHVVATCDSVSLHAQLPKVVFLGELFQLISCCVHFTPRKSIENIVENVLPVIISSSVDILFDLAGLGGHQFEICYVLVHVKTNVDVSGCGKMCHGCRSKLRIMCSR